MFIHLKIEKLIYTHSIGRELWIINNIGVYDLIGDYDGKCLT